VLLVDDPDARIEGSFVHWVLCGLDPGRRPLSAPAPEGEPTSRSAAQGISGGCRAFTRRATTPASARIASTGGEQLTCA
jgi:phosphatidylethanolamine-binding protein (PEBP) family uncharacterized protein